MAKVEIYTGKRCGACVSAKRLLDSKSIEYQEIRLGLSRRSDAEFRLRTNGAKTVPQIFINDQWIGDSEALRKYDQAGELDWRLGLEPQPKISLAEKAKRFLMGEKY